MRELTATGEADLASSYAHPDGPWLRANMVTSLDGAAEINGRVGALTGGADQQLLHLLRTFADVVLVGAGTIRAEGYGPIRVDEATAAARVARGQTPEPGLAIVTSSCALDPSTSLFTQARTRPLILTGRNAPEGRVAALAPVADVLTVGDQGADPHQLVAALHDRGLTGVLTEGGPHLLGELFAADLVDELCLALSPLVTGGGLSASTGSSFAPKHLRLHAMHCADDFLFLQYRR